MFHVITGAAGHASGPRAGSVLGPTAIERTKPSTLARTEYKVLLGWLSLQNSEATDSGSGHCMAAVKLPWMSSESGSRCSPAHTL